MSSNEPLTRIAIESLRAIARDPERNRPTGSSTPAQRLELLNAILIRDQDATPVRVGRHLVSRGTTRL